MGCTGSRAACGPRLRGTARRVGRPEAVEPVLGRHQVVSREVICSRGGGRVGRKGLVEEGGG
jgi:hypothetical protein